MDGHAARENADVAREEHKTEEENVQLAAITLYLHLAGFELHRGKSADGAAPSRFGLSKLSLATRHVCEYLVRCCVAVGEGRNGAGLLFSPA